MAHFYASIQGNRGGASRMGTTSSGIEGHIRGWDIGIEVMGGTNSDTGEDTFCVYLTPGSNGGQSVHLIGRFTRADLDKVVS